jgi:inosose dehydratase
MQFGCQTYTWQMSYDKYADALDHIMDVVASAGFSGLEAEVCMLGRYRSEPVKLAEALARRKLALGAICLVCDWLGAEETAAEFAEADRVIAFLQRCPGAMLALCQMPGKDRADLQVRQRNCLSCCNAIAKRAAAVGISAGFHPNSPPGSVFRTQADYAVLLDGLDTKVLGFAPDAGHIAKGGMNPAEIFRHYAPVIRHVHYKDMSQGGSWAEMGKGNIDFRTITGDLMKAGYAGWIMIEDESARAEADPDAVTRANGEYLRARAKMDAV